jgi:hypothetical protein
MEPTFVGIGVQKCGTSSVAGYLSDAGADIPTKELHYFSKEKNPNRDGYLREFDRCNKDGVFGEFTPDYIHYTRHLALLSSYLETTKFLIVLRNPIDRFYSAVNHGRGKGVIPAHWSAKKVFDYVLGGHSFEHWLQTPILKGYYGAHVERAFRILGRDRTMVLFLEELIGGGLGERNRRELLEFVGLEATHSTVEFAQTNNAKHQLKGTSPIRREGSVDSALAELYSPSMEKLARVLGRRLPWDF